MTLENLKNYIKAWAWADSDGAPLPVAVGAIDERKERCVGVYPGRPPAAQRVCLGGADATLTDALFATVLVHWGKNMREAADKAREIYALFYAWPGGEDVAHRMDGVRVYAVEPGGGPVPVGRDAHGVCEFVIHLQIICEKYQAEERGQ